MRKRRELHAEWGAKMEIIKHAVRSCTVNNMGDELWCKSALVSTDCEAFVYIVVDLNNKIKDVRWELYRAPFNYEVKSGEILDLGGQSIFSYSSRYTARFLDSASRDLILELITEGVRGVMQTSRFPGKNTKTVPTPEELNRRPLSEFLTGKCAFHSLPNRAELSRSFREKNYAYPGISLFHRQKNYQIYSLPDQSFYAIASFADSDHEIVVNSTFTANGMVTAVSASFLRLPHPICDNTKDLLKSLHGKNLAHMNKKGIAEFIGGPHGCTHLVEICYDLILELSQLVTD